jgi:hypothetical protein
MYKLFYIVIRPDETNPLFYESPDFLPFRAAMEEVRVEMSNVYTEIKYPDGAIPNSKGMLLAFKTKNDWLMFKNKLNEKVSFESSNQWNNFVEQGAAEYCQEKNHILLMKIHDGDQLVHRKKLVDSTIAGTLPSVHQL